MLICVCVACDVPVLWVVECVFVCLCNSGMCRRGGLVLVQPIHRMLELGWASVVVQSMCSQDSVVVMGTITRDNGVLRELSAQDVETCDSCDL